MKVGDMVRPLGVIGDGSSGEEDWIGVIIGFTPQDWDPDNALRSRYAIVHWNSKFPEEEEYLHQIEVISECG